MENTNRSNLNFELFFSLHLDLMCIASLEGTFLKLNKSWEDVLGYDNEALLNTNFLDYIHPDDLQPTLDSMQSLESGIQILNFTNRYKHKDGSYRHIEWRSHSIDGMIYAAARDITGYKEKEEELKQNQTRLKAILESQANYVIRIDANLNYTFVNRKYEEDYGWIFKNSGFIGQNCAVSVEEHSIAGIQACVELCYATPGQTFQVEVDQKQEDGSCLNVLWECFGIVDENGKPMEMQCMGVDITERKRAEEEELRRQQSTILEMSTPITQLWDGILLLPLVGLMTAQRAESVIRSVLKKIADTQAKVLILDISGVPVVDTQVANNFIKLSKATKLMGCLCTMSGISPAVAQTIIELGIQIEEVTTTGTMKDALENALLQTGLKIRALKELK